jgi:Flp pilus assembly protein TadG
MKSIKSQKGQALIIIALAAVVLFGFAALTIDGSRSFSDRRHAQNTADTAALTAALAKIRNQNFTDAARARAASNGYDNNGVTNFVTVNNPPAYGPYAGNSEYIQVVIKSHVPTTFARILGWTQFTNTVDAVARAKGSTVLGGTSLPALAACKKDGTPFTGSGNGTLNVVGSGIFSNSTDTGCPNGAIKLGGTITYTVDGGYSSPGTACTVGGVPPVTTTSAAQIDCSTLYNYPPPAFTCSGTPSPMLIGNEYQPGTYNSLNPPPGGNYSFAPGNYCFNGNVTFNGGSLTANNVNIRMNSGEFSTKGTSTFTCSNMVFHSAGGSGISFNGGVNNCTETIFYLETGGVGVKGNSDSTFKAPTSGTYTNLLIYLPLGNSSAISINGNSGSKIYGSIIAVSSHVELNGNNNSDGLHTQIVSDTIGFNGNGTTKIIFDTHVDDPDPASPAIEFTD